MNKIDLFIIKLIAKKQLQKHRRRKHYVSYEKAQSILLLFEYEKADDIETMKMIIQNLKMENKKFLALGFSKSKEKEFEQSEALKIYQKTSISFFSKPKQQLICDIESQEFDILIDLSSENNLFLSYLTIYANAAMKLSTKTELPHIFDFIVNTKQNKEFEKEKLSLNKNQLLLNEIFFYLKNIQTKD